MTDQAQWLFARVSLSQYLKQVQKNKVTERHIYSVNGVLFGYNGALNWARLDNLDEEYYRNLFILSDVKDGKITLTLEPETTYYFMSWKPNYDNEELEEYTMDYNISEFITDSTGKKTLTLDNADNIQYKLSKAETYYTQAPEDLVPEQ